MTPEQKARQEIDRQLAACGWVVQNHKAMNIMAGLGVAVREFPLKTGFADYLLYVDGKVIGLAEVKPEGHTLSGVEIQSSKYTLGLPDAVPHYRKPLPFAYESTGTVTQFTNSLEPDFRSREVFTFHRPDELLRLVQLDSQVRANLRTMPALDDARLWSVQSEAVTNLEASLAANRPRALIQMATGSGKTYTACSFCYRLIKFAKAKRILFLVDRNNLGRQTLSEFQQYVSPVNGYKFTDEYNVQHLKKNTIDPAAKVCITTIQRLYSMLKGEEEFDEGNEESSLFESASPLIREPLPVVHVAVLKLVDSVDKQYLQHVLNSPFCYSQSQRYTHGVGNQDLGLTRMVKIALPLPPLSEQHAIVEEVERRVSLLNSLESELDTSLRRSTRLRQAILKRAFEGKLVPQDPNDEPASILLERIRARGAEDAAPKNTRARKQKAPEGSPQKPATRTEPRC